MTDVMEIDGSYLEGGGQILRNALSLSCILCRPIRVVKIRSNRPNPGLSNQHLYGLNLLQQITNARVKGNYLKSTEVEFYPGVIKSGKYKVDTRTAASVSLVLQAALPVLIFGNSDTELELIGGTNVGMAPQVDFMTEVFRPNLEKFGITFDFDLFRRGYYPRGGGRCKVTIPPVRQIKSAQIVKFGSVQEVCGWCFVAGHLPLRLAEDMKNAICEGMQQFGRDRLSLEAYAESPEMARDNGSGVIANVTTSEGCIVGAAALGNNKKPCGQTMGSQISSELANYVINGTCIDQYVQDQLIIFMALANGVSRLKTCKITDHTKTAMHVVEMMVGVSFNIEHSENENIIIECKGTGYINSNIK